MSSSLVNLEKCVTDYFDGAMCAAEAPRGPGLVARMEETSHAAGCCREPPSAPPARAEEPNLDTPSGTTRGHGADCELPRHSAVDSWGATAHALSC